MLPFWRDLAVIDPDDAVAEAANLIELVGDEDDGAAGAGDVAHFAEAFFLEVDVADGEDFVDEEDFGLEVGGDGEGEADVHAAGVVFDGGVDEFFEFGEGDDFVELAGDFGFAHAEDGAGEEDVFAAGELGMEAGADFEEAADAAVNFGVAGGGVGDAGEDFEQSGFAGTVAADEAEDFAFLDVEGDVFERPDVGRCRRSPSCFHSRSLCHWPKRDSSRTPRRRAGARSTSPITWLSALGCLRCPMR